MIFIGMALLSLLWMQQVLAQQSEVAQLVVLQVKEINKIGLVGGPLTLRINRISEGATQPDPAVDGTTKLLWTSNGDNRKIAVASNVTSPRFILKIQAEKISEGAGMAEPRVTLSGSETHDLIVGVRRSAGGCTLKFTAVADASQGVGSEAHLITYTITGC